MPVSLSIAEADQEDIMSYTEYQLQQKKRFFLQEQGDGKLKVYNESECSSVQLRMFRHL